MGLMAARQCPRKQTVRCSDSRGVQFIIHIHLVSGNASQNVASPRVFSARFCCHTKVFLAGLFSSPSLYESRYARLFCMVYVTGAVGLCRVFRLFRACVLRCLIALDGSFGSCGGVVIDLELSLCGLVNRGKGATDTTTSHREEDFSPCGYTGNVQAGILSIACELEIAVDLLA